MPRNTPDLDGASALTKTTSGYLPPVSWAIFAVATADCRDHDHSIRSARARRVPVASPTIQVPGMRGWGRRGAKPRPNVAETAIHTTISAGGQSRGDVLGMATSLAATRPQPRRPASSPGGPRHATSAHRVPPVAVQPVWRQPQEVLPELGRPFTFSLLPLRGPDCEQSGLPAEHRYHWHPARVRRIQKVPLRTTRWSFHCLPRRRLLGNRSSPRSNWTSDNSYRRVALIQASLPKKPQR